MLKPITVFLLMIMFVTGTMQGQTLSDPSKKSQMNLRQAVSRETEKIKNESAVIDAKKLEKMQQQTPQKKWSKDRLIITGIVVALVVLAVVLALNSKRCIRRDPPGCNFADDINCECLEYAQ